MKELNLVEILKDCPKGTKLYSPICGNCELEEVEDIETTFPICVLYQHNEFKNRIGFTFTKEGYPIADVEDSECLLFPSKDNRDWSTFRIPFRDGDIVTYEDGDGNVKVFIFNEYMNDGYAACYVAYFSEKALLLKKSIYGYRINRLATEEEKGKLFKAMADNGYKWNPDTKEVETLEEEKQKWNPDTLQPFNMVLVRDNENDIWRGDFFLYKQGAMPHYPYICIRSEWRFCIPYNEETKHLLGTNQEAPEYYNL